MAFDNVSAFFDALKNRIDTDTAAQEQIKSIGATYHFSLSGDGGGDYLLNLAELSITQGDGSSDCKVNMETDDFLQLVNGETDGMTLFTMGKLMIEGDMTLALRLQEVLDAG